MVGETAKRKRGPFLGLPVMLMILLRNTRFGATTSIFKDNATSPYHGRMDEPEYCMFDSEISRMLLDKGHVTGGIANRKRQAVDCSRGRQYSGICLPKRNEATRPENCGRGSRYNRNC
jgi:hypothetical protein